ncbi:MAG: SLBB domain-containing protein [Planctomycetota bacterium]
MRSASSLALVVVFAGCSFDPVYKPPPGEKAPVWVESSVMLPPPPALPPPAPAPDLKDLRGTGDSQTKLRANDVVSVLVRDEPELSVARARVTREGALRLPWLGELKVVGLTRGELQARLEEKIKRTLVRAPDVAVELISEECRRCYVLGRVTRPGLFPLPVGRRPSLVEVIALAGGFTTSKSDLEADPSAIRLIRSIQGTRKTFRISFEEIVEREKLDDDVTIEPDDVIFVPPKRELYIFGSVTRPGSFPLSDGSRLSIDEVLSLAGGFGPTAERNRITVIRHSASTSAESYHVNMADERQRATVQVTANDTIIVGDRQTRRVFVIGNVGRQGSFELDEKGLTVVRILAIAGGLNKVADGDAVRLLRATPEGRKIFRVPVNSIIKENRTEDDPILVPGDIIFVPESFF